MALQAFSQLAQRTFGKSSMNQQIQTALALERCGKVLDALLDEDTRLTVRPLYIRYKALTLACKHSSAAACISPFEQEIMEYVNGGFPQPLIQRVRVILDTDYSHEAQ